MKDAFTQRFEETKILRWRRAKELHQRAQRPSESVDDYVTAMRKLEKSLGIDGEAERYAVQRNLRPEIVAHVMRDKPMTVDDV